MAYIYDTYESTRGERDQENRVDGSKDTLCLSWLSAPAFKYYTQYHYDFSRKYGDFFLNNFHIIHYKGRESGYVKEKSKEILRKNRNAWFLFSHFRSYEVNAVREAVGTEKKGFPGAMVFYVAGEKRM